MYHAAAFDSCVFLPWIFLHRGSMLMSSIFADLQNYWGSRSSCPCCSSASGPPKVYFLPMCIYVRLLSLLSFAILLILFSCCSIFRVLCSGVFILTILHVHVHVIKNLYQVQRQYYSYKSIMYYKQLIYSVPIILGWHCPFILVICIKLGVRQYYSYKSIM